MPQFAQSHLKNSGFEQTKNCWHLAVLTLDFIIPALVSLIIAAVFVIVAVGAFVLNFTIVSTGT
jgi:hypothetical protein